MTVDYTHEALNQEITAVAGHYTLVKEVRMPYGDREILYHVAHSLFDTACCGSGGCGYAIVRGTISRWGYRQDDEGKPVTEVMPVEEDRDQAEIRQRILKAEMLSQVVFMV